MDSSSKARYNGTSSSIIEALRSSPWATISTAFGGLTGLALLRSWRLGLFTLSTDEAEPGLFTKHSTFEAFRWPSGTFYPRIRVFHHPHSQAKKLPDDLPLLVFMHGLGGNATQFAPLLASLTNVAPCLCIDLPGCGLSDLRPAKEEAYTTLAFAELVHYAIERYRDKERDQKVVLIGHSMGCSITTLLASSTSPLQSKLDLSYIIGCIAICPRASPPSIDEVKTVKRLRYLPVWLFSLFRLVDRRGGADSASITRVVGEGADHATRKLQLRYNAMSESRAFLRILIATLPHWPSTEVWQGITVPLFLVGGESDKLTSVNEIENIASMLVHRRDSAVGNLATAPTAESHGASLVGLTSSDGQLRASEVAGTGLPSTTGDASLEEQQVLGTSSTEIESSNANTETTPLLSTSAAPITREHNTKHAFALKTTIFPAPAAHGLMYATPTVPILSGLIETFLAHHVDERLSCGWQLQHMTTSGKWDVKNLTKWQAIDACSEPIGGVFRAMKTMREVDDVHCPSEFANKYGWEAVPDGVAVVVDISHESPVYDPKGLEIVGIEYRKFPTVSKLPPTADEVEHFIALIDSLRKDLSLEASGGRPHYVIGVHCHYGFNRTGFFLVCYLVERLGYRLQDAIAEFASKRPPGIKHPHFINELYVRYAVKMERRGTII